MEGFFQSKLWKITWKILLVLVLAVIFNPFSCVSASNRGVKVRFGAVQDGVVKPGLVVRLPVIEHIQSYSIQPQTLTFKISTGADGAITKDNQTVGVSMSIFYRLSSDRIVEIARSYSQDRLETILRTTSESALKSVIGGYTIFDLASTQVEVSKKVHDVIAASIQQYPIEVVDLKLTNYDWSDHFDAQIQETMAKAQQVKQKEQELQITQLEAQKQVKEADAKREATILQAEGKKQASITEAEGEKQAAITAAEGEKQSIILAAEAKIAEGEGLRKYNQSIAANLEIELKLRQLSIELERVQKWDGKYVPNNMYGPIPVNTTGGVQGK